MEVLRGKVQTGENDASRWLALLNAAYSRKLGMPVFPGSLNLGLPDPFDWLAPRYQPHLIHFDRQENGGERDILLLPCILANLDRRVAYLWTAIHPTNGVGATSVVEVIADVKLRAAYGLSDGDIVEVELHI